MLPVQPLVTWTIVQEEREKVAKTADGEWLHASRYTCDISGVVTTWKVDNWINAQRHSPFVDLTAFRRELQLGRYKATQCLLDAVVPMFVQLPQGWDWHPSAVHPPLPVVGAPSAEVLAAIPLLMAVRGEIEVRERVGMRLNHDSIGVVSRTTKQDLPLNWTAALRAGRKQINELLGSPPGGLPPIKSPNDLNPHVLRLMCEADTTGLAKLLAMGLIDPTGYQGNPFLDRVKGYALEPDNSKALNSAFNHLRFVLYLEFHALRQMLYDT